MHAPRTMCYSRDKTLHQQVKQLLALQLTGLPKSPTRPEEIAKSPTTPNLNEHCHMRRKGTWPQQLQQTGAQTHAYITWKAIDLNCTQHKIAVN